MDSLQLERVEIGMGGYLAYWDDGTPNANAKIRNVILLLRINVSVLAPVVFSLVMDALRHDTLRFERIAPDYCVLTVAARQENASPTELLNNWGERINALLQQFQTAEERDLALDYNNR